MRHLIKMLVRFRVVAVCGLIGGAGVVAPGSVFAHAGVTRCDDAIRILTTRLDSIDRFLGSVPEGSPLYAQLLWRKHRLQAMIWSRPETGQGPAICDHWNADTRPGTSADDGQS